MNEHKEDIVGGNRGVTVSGDFVSITIRFPPDLHQRIKTLAQNERRSFNSQVVRMLELYLDNPDER